VLECDHTIAAVQGLSAQCRACRVSTDSLAGAAGNLKWTPILGTRG